MFDPEEAGVGSEAWSSATEHARFGVMEPRQGLFAGGGTTARLPRQISFAHAMEFLLTAEPFPAERALEMGLINELVPEDELLGRPTLAELVRALDARVVYGDAPSCRA